MLILEYILAMAPTAATPPPPAQSFQTFEAIADGVRRTMLELLAAEERPVGDLVDTLGLAQPAVSKHLRVLRDAGLVSQRKDGRRRLYQTRAAGLRPIHAWTQQFERHWQHSLDDIKARAERKARDSKNS